MALWNGGSYFPCCPSRSGGKYPSNARGKGGNVKKISRPLPYPSPARNARGRASAFVGANSAFRPPAAAGGVFRSVAPPLPKKMLRLFRGPLSTEPVYMLQGAPALAGAPCNPSGPISRVLRRSKLRLSAARCRRRRLSLRCSSSPLKNAPPFFGVPSTEPVFILQGAPALAGAPCNPSGPISRVLSSAVIYLRLPSPIGSSVIHGTPSGGQPV